MFLLETLRNRSAICSKQLFLLRGFRNKTVFSIVENETKEQKNAKKLSMLHYFGVIPPFSSVYCSKYMFLFRTLLGAFRNRTVSRTVAVEKRNNKEALANLSNNKMNFSPFLN